MQSTTTLTHVNQTPGRECPNCGAEIPVDPAYPPWCDQCNWNILAGSPNAPIPQNVFEAMYLRAGEKIGAVVFKRLVRTRSFEASLTGSIVLAFLIAFMTYGVALLFIWFGFSLAIRWNVAEFGFSVPGVMLIGIGLFTLPRPAALPTDQIANREYFPTLYKLVNDIAAGVGAKPVEFIVIGTAYNASFHRAGWIPKSVLYIGVPLFTVLTPQERVAILGHELAHSAHGDSSRSFVISGALHSLQTLREIFPGLYTVVVFPMLLGVLAHYALLHLVASDSQRAEYLADQLGAQVGGTGAMLGVLRKLHMSEAVMLSRDRYFERGEKTGLFDAMKRKVESIPPRELERIGRVERLITSRLDASHPPTAYRIELLESRTAREPEIVLSDEDTKRLDDELAGVMPELEAIMRDNYKWRMGH
jgi:Zn-dependent protease with chaperone function